MERRTTLEPARDLRNPDPEKNAGIRPAKLIFEVIGYDGRVKFEVGTGWHRPETEKEFFELGHWTLLRPYGDEVTIHGSGGMVVPINVHAEMFQLLVEQGSEAVFEKLERLYERFVLSAIDAEVVEEAFPGEPLLLAKGET